MAREVWQVVKTQHCERIGKDASLEVHLVFPADILPDQQPRVLGHRCSHGLYCNQLHAPTCQWAGTLPGYDPFR
ncbi:MAG: hypothetical protein P8Z42_08355 [Anaerolineales bacterium]|jgi:hypothetical protein